MNEEEKKAIETAKCIRAGIPVGTCNDDYIYLLNLIEKQQKEIKELKERNKKQFLNYEKRVNELEYKQLNYISKDKIRELVAKHKLEYEEQWSSSYGSYYKFAKDVKELLEE